MFHRILVPVDFSDSSVRALRLAVQLARESGGHLTLFHCAGAPDLTAMGPGAVVYYQQVADQLARELDHHLTRMAKDEVPESLSHDKVRVAGFPPAEIVARAKSGKYDLIAMGTHGRTGLTHVIMGSVAARVIQRAEVPVLVCR